jgi:hypothetical protein
MVDSARVDGKPRIVRQVYLGSIDKIIEGNHLLNAEGVETHTSCDVLEFGAASALLDVSERLGIRKIIDDVIGKGDQGLPVGDSLNSCCNQSCRCTCQQESFLRKLV